VRTRPRHLIRALTANGHRVTLATLLAGTEEQRAVEELSGEVAAVLTEPMGTARALWNCLSAAPTGEPLQARYSWSPALARTLRRALDERRFDVVHVEHLRGARYGVSILEYLAQPGRTGVPVVWDSVDCISDLFRSAARRGPTAQVRWVARFELPRTERYEAAITPRFARVLTTSESDRRGLLAVVARRQAVPADFPSRVVVIPNGVDLEHFTPAGAPREAATLVMSGKMSYHANVAAVSAFVVDVMPRIRQRRPETRLVVVGKDPTPAIRALAGCPGVEVTGTVDDVRPYLQRAAVAVAPIQYGVGIQNKVLEAMACGTPVVATQGAVEALGAAADRDLVVADGPEAMTERIVGLLERPDERLRIGEAGRRYVEAHHDWRRIAARLAETYADAR
jgi:sugar transferase (PEP-CTERM/EpsH1 system associated)